MKDALLKSRIKVAALGRYPGVRDCLTDEFILFAKYRRMSQGEWLVNMTKDQKRWFMLFVAEAL